MSDYKYGMFLRASELAEERYNADFYALPDDIQVQLMDEAATNYVERRIP